MSISESESDFNQVTNSTIKNIKSLHTFADPSEVKKVLFFIESGKNITPNDIYSSVNTIQSNTNIKKDSFHKTQVGIRPEFIEFSEEGIPVKIRRVSNTGRHKIIDTECKSGKI